MLPDTDYSAQDHDYTDDDDYADGGAGDDDNADLACTVIQLDLRSLFQHRIVGNSVIFVIAQDFLLSSVAQPVGRDHA